MNKMHCDRLVFLKDRFRERPWKSRELSFPLLPSESPEQSSIINSHLTLPKLDGSKAHSFKRRECLPLPKNRLWQIDVGAVRTYTLNYDGTIIALGFWGTEDIVGHSLACIQPYIVECLTNVKVRALELDQCLNLNQLLLSHLHQTQVLLRTRSGQTNQRLQQLLNWLVNKFGDESDRGQVIRLRLTHQEIADALGTTRVTVTRLLSQFEQEGRIGWAGPYLLLPRME